MKLIFIFLLPFTSMFAILDSTASSYNKFVVDSVCIKGNTKTKSEIILRELTFNVGDTITNDEWE